MATTAVADAGTSSKPDGGASNTWAKLAFSLVVVMLASLLILVGLLLWRSWPQTLKQEVTGQEMLDFYKSALSILVGAFGAWIGAGAAYFFGRENLAESSRSTETALKIQQETFRAASKPSRVSDLALTAMNRDFMFTPASTKDEVVKGLQQHLDYWWVPILKEKGKGALVDILHARVIWDPAIDAATTLEQVLKDVDTGDKLAAYRPLHGAAFYETVQVDDRLADVSAKMAASRAVVGIVVDGKGQPTYCFTRQDVVTAMG
jgi:hypothetical protein